MSAILKLKEARGEGLEKTDDSGECLCLLSSFHILRPSRFAAAIFLNVTDYGEDKKYFQRQFHLSIFTVLL